MKESKIKSIRSSITYAGVIVFTLAVSSHIEARDTTRPEDQISNEQNSEKETKDEKKTLSKVVDPIKLWYRITGAITATRYPYLDQTEETWPSGYRTIVNAWHDNFGIDGPEGTGFIYPSVVVLDSNDNIQQIAVVETASLVSEERSAIWQFLSNCFDNKGPVAKFSVYVPVEQKEKAKDLLKKKHIKNYNLHGYRIERGYLEIDGTFVHNVVDVTVADIENFGEIPDNQKVKTETQRYRVIRINATTGYPYFDQADNSWSMTFKPAVVNDETKRFGLIGPGDMGTIYPSILILDEGDYIRLIGMMEPAENVTEERAKVWEFLSNSLDNQPLKFLYIHVPHGLEAKALDILERHKSNYSGLRGYSVVDGKLLITLITTLSGAGDNR